MGSYEYREGYHAYLNDLYRDLNPYDRDNESRKYKDWEDGWQNAAEDD